MKQVTVLIISAFTALSSLCYEYPKPVSGYFSQKGQDKFLNEKVFKGKRNGIFVEAGAHDGVSFSNSYFFEKYLDWIGICVEPNPDIFKLLTQNRCCICEQICIAKSKGQMPFLKCSSYMLEMYSGLLENYDDRHLERIKNEMDLFGGNQEVIYVNCMSFKELFEEHHIAYIDFLSLDVEGGEEAAIKTIDFDAVKINVIVVENNFNEDKVKKYLLTKGYQYIEQIGKDDIYLLKDKHE